MNRIATLVSLVVLCALAPVRAAEPVSEDAWRHLIRGRTAVEMARSPDDYRAAIQEFERAVQLAPHWPDAHYNLGMVQARAGRSREAIASLKRYLELAPNAPDAAQVRDEIVALEYRLERAAQLQTLEREWAMESLTPGVALPFGPVYVLKLDGDRIVLHGKPRAPTPPEAEVVLDSLGGPAPFEGFAGGEFSERFELKLDGQALRGQYVREAWVEKKSRCQIPEDRSDAQGSLDAAQPRITLKYRYRVYRARYSTALFTTQCSGVTAVREAETTLNLVPRNAPPAGRIGIGIAQDEATGQIVIREVLAGLPAARAGLRAGDRLIAVDGEEVTGSSVAEIVQRLRGAPGTTVTVTVRREGSEGPLAVAIERAAGATGAAPR
ncbi:MAG: tetratricopeptide repeat protein [Burkholderiaceae bacterium]